jgi:hypothetical protein
MAKKRNSGTSAADERAWMSPESAARVIKPLGWGEAYESDIAAWADEQAAALRRLQPSGLDWRNIAEELDDMGRSEQRALESHLQVLLVHLLKWSHEPNRRSPSWEASIDNARDEIEVLLKRSPSLAGKLDEAVEIAYRRARRQAGAEMQWTKRQWERRLPKKCEWEIEDLRDPGFLEN